MKITFLIGNGFDINIGMKTRYSDFYNYYVKTESKNDLIKTLKENLNNNHENWADLELAFGEYTENLKTIDEFDIVFDDLREKLSEYIKLEEDKYDFSTFALDEIYEDLVYPEKHLLLGDRQIIEDYKSNWNSVEWMINIVSFNYSTALEKLLKYDDERILFHEQSDKIRASSLYLVKHIHGYTHKEMVLGVNDISQIKNEKLKSNPDILTGLVKPECNKAYKHLNDSTCLSLIKTSNLICLFGLSIGDTDKIWWETIGKVVNENTNSRLIIFMRGNDLPANQEYKKIRKERLIKDYFLSKTNLTDKQKEDIKEKIFISYNSNIFNVKVKQNEKRGL